MRKQLTLVLMLALAIAMVGTALTYAGGRGLRNGGMRQGEGLNVRESLTEDQLTALHGKVTEMREAGATREEIHAVRREMLEGYGIELPENFGQRGGDGLNLRESLTEDQLTGLHGKVTEMREAGATREEIHAVRRTMLEGFGIELPEDFGQRGGLGRGGFRMYSENCPGDCLSEESAAASEEIAPLARITATTAVQSAGWGQIKSRMK